MEGWITLHRKIMQWEWYTDVVVKTFFLHCLIKANHSDKEWRGLTIKRGQFVSSLSKLASETGLTVKQVRRAINCLEKTKELGKKKTQSNTWITVTYYDDYQKQGTEKARKGQRKGQGKGTERATTNNDNNDNNELNNENKGVVFPFDSEYFLDQWKIWKDYKKKEFKFKYKTAQSEQAALTGLNNLANGSEDTAIKIIHQSLAKGWKGLFKLENNEKRNSKTIQEYANRIQAKYEGLDL